MFVTRGSRQGRWLTLAVLVAIDGPWEGDRLPAPKRILAKFGARDRAQAVVGAYERGMVP